ncbi:ENDO-14-BETA-GLUCANASE [Salix viminalis]|uniref:cellulase n=1 Tax=Salix viminalis TaxID=40686 RepID=A0A9Q0UVH2_SALVM|nr:ENDO-14-BETA-GLUCANASE [Salix viminalis]
MASASLVFKKIDSSYSNLLLEHAQQLFSFADAYRAKDLSCLKHVAELNGQQFADWGNPSWFSWDDKHAGTQQVLLSRANLFGAEGMPSEENLDLQMYRKTSEAIMCELLPDSPTLAEQKVVWYESRNGTACNMLWLLHF